MEDVTLNLEPTDKQYDALLLLKDKVTRFLLFGGGAEGGKSWLGAEWLLQNCYAYPDTKWFIGRNELKRLMASSYATFRKVTTFHNIPQEDWTLNGQYNYIQFKNKSRIDLLDLKYMPSDPMYQRFGSTEYTGGWIEEAGEVHFMAFDVLKSRLGRWNNDTYDLFPKLLLTCNPEQNWLYRIFYKPWKRGELEDGYAFIQSLYSDNPHTAAQAEARLDQIKDPVLRSRLKLGLWEYSTGDNSLVDFDSIVDLFTNTLQEEAPKKYFTGDVARHGSDKTTLASWNGFDLYKLQWKVDRGIDQTAEDVRSTLRDEMIPYSQAVVDDDGIGGGVVDTVRGIKGFVGNATALPLKVKQEVQGERKDERKENYRNLRSQCGFMLAQAITAHQIKISSYVDEVTKEQIIEDLQGMLKKKETPLEAPLQLIGKDEVKEILGRSPDFADTMLMRFYFELDKPRQMHVTEQGAGVLPYYTDVDGMGPQPPAPELPKPPMTQKGGVDWDL